ncbi:MAG TPA: HIT domain-containing protein, partial [Phycisphaerae bacterium]|nr:HIT domain-containing protein [Phycisphaerae bacterium]
MSEYQKNLWAPWRMEYIASLGPNADNGCFLCRAIAAPQADAENHVLWRCPQTLTLLNLFPYSTGHVLVAPTTHVGEPEDLPDAVLLEMMQRARDAKRVLQAAVEAQGFNIGINLGRCAGAGLPGHL